MRKTHITVRKAVENVADSKAIGKIANRVAHFRGSTEEYINNDELLQTDVCSGLTKEEVRKRNLEGLSNIATHKPSKTNGQIIFSNIFTYFNLIFFTFAFLLCLVHSYTDMTFMPIVVWNTIIGIVQEIRAKAVLDKINVVNAPKTKVVRNSKTEVVDSTALVRGDICIFSAGNQICADSVIRQGSIIVNESLITGEADDVVKEEGDLLLSGSFVVSGECRVVLTAVGNEAYAQKLNAQAKASRKKTKTSMMASLNRMVSLIGIVIIPVGLMMYIQNVFFLHTSIKDSVVSTIASLVGMIPEGLYLLASVTLVVSIMRLAKQQVLIHEMNCVETLARVNVLCVDKTGTITNPEMSVSNIYYIDNGDSQEEIEKNRLEIDRLIRLSAGSQMDDNETMKAIRMHFMKADNDAKADEVCPFSSKYKYSASRFNDMTYVFGAPEYVLLDDIKDYKAKIDNLTEAGVRVLAFGRTNERLGAGAIHKPIELLAFICLENKIRKNAKETFAYFKEEGVTIKVISGDNPLTVSRVSVMAGIENADKYIDATSLETYEDIKKVINEITVFGRVVPEQKKLIIKAIKESGNTVAMTGDGVNDVLALKEADCSIAMESGSEAASNAAQIVLLDSDFAKMPQVVAEGRRVVNNIGRSATLFLVKNILSIFLTIFTIFAANLYPLYPTQLSLLGAFTIGIPSFVLALQPNKNRIRGHFLVGVIVNALPSGIADFISVVMVVIYGNIVGLSHDCVSTMCILTMIAIGIGTLVRISYPFNTLRISLICLMVLGITLSIIITPKLFRIAILSFYQWQMTFLFMFVGVGILFILVRVSNKLMGYLLTHNEKFRRIMEE
ncbi:HAD-IC family P-type ATPase [Lachnospira multipara]|uniref:HAD-IC family P-type ATPase n=1 Tax=Lachnospira multipara TaxID=28051 RepID=UPI0009DCF6FB|nr:HAD-IC family P-type ATPase [Lachnospira multipara]